MKTMKDFGSFEERSRIPATNNRSLDADAHTHSLAAFAFGI